MSRPVADDFKYLSYNKHTDQKKNWILIQHICNYYKWYVICTLICKTYVSWGINCLKPKYQSKKMVASSLGLIHQHNSRN